MVHVPSEHGPDAQPKGLRGGGGTAGHPRHQGIRRPRCQGGRSAAATGRIIELGGWAFFFSQKTRFSLNMESFFYSSE